jgi:hypothetical protein
MFLSQTLPSDSYPTRLPLGDCPTAVSRPFANLTLDFTTANTDVTSVTSGTSIAAWSRDPFHAFIHQIKAPGAWTQSAYFFSYTLGENAGFPMPTRAATESETHIDLPIFRLQANTSNLTSFMSDPNTVGNIQDNVSCMFINAATGHNTTVTVTATGGNFTANVDFLKVRYWDYTSWQELTDVAAAGGSPNIAVALSVPGYYSFGLTCQTASATLVSFSLAVSGTTDFYAIEPVPGFLAKKTYLTGARVLSASVLASERSSAMYSGGSVFAAQLPRAQCWYPNATIPILSASQGAYQGDLSKGCYGYHRVLEEEDFIMADCFANTSGNFMGPILPSIQPPGGWCMMLFTTPLITGAYPGGLMNCVVFFHMEYTTMDMWPEVEQSPMDYLAYRSTLDQIRRFPQFHENPLHWADVGRFLSSVGRGIWKVGPGLLNAMSSVIPALQPYNTVVQAAKSAFS